MGQSDNVAGEIQKHADPLTQTSKLLFAENGGCPDTTANSPKPSYPEFHSTDGVDSRLLLFVHLMFAVIVRQRAPWHRPRKRA